VNRIFSPDGQGWPEFPKVAYGRLDQTEPLVPAGASEAMFAFDVVDANWGEFGPSAQFDLSNAPRIATQQEQYWRRLFGKLGPGLPPDPYDSAPIYRIEVTSLPGDPYFDFLTQIKETDWVRIELDRIGSFEVDVYGGLFAAPVQAHLQKITIETASMSALTVAFDMVTWPNAAETDIRSVLNGLSRLDYLVAYDIGQGSANGLSDVHETAQLFFDLGCGVYGNRKTRPVPLRFCWRAAPPIVLSHWDSDHWAGETSDPAAAGRTWIAPRQTIGPTHTAFAARILSAGGTIHIWGAAPSTITVHLASGQELDLGRCSGSSRNGSGISCAVKDSVASRGWLLTGDAGYHELNQPGLPSELRAVVVPHHGADMGTSSTPPTPPTGYTRLLYSFGPGNTHGRTHAQHPTWVGVNAHISRGWKHNHWLPATPATCVAGGDVLATASHPGTHLDGAVAAWTGPPSVPFTTIPCAGVPAGLSGCTGQIVQA
jgi:hypothetical protein